MIQDRSLVTDIFPWTTSNLVTLNQIEQIEHIWAHGNISDEKIELPKILIEYWDEYEYSQTYLPLINFEEMQDKKLKNWLETKGLTIEWIWEDFIYA